MNLHPLIACAALTCLSSSAAVAQAANSRAAAGSAGPIEVGPAITQQHPSQKSASKGAREAFTASTPAVTNLKQGDRKTLSNREKLDTFHTHRKTSVKPSDDALSNAAVYSSPYDAPSRDASSRETRP
jgi:hypothetical protein